jgi:transketolase
MYIRLGKNGEPTIHKNHFKFKIGKGITLKDGKDATIFATGNMLESAKRVSELLQMSGIEIRLISMPSIKPIDEEIICKAMEETGAISRLKNILKQGGLGVLFWKSCTNTVVLNPFLKN